jgi:hypothetical protein
LGARITFEIAPDRAQWGIEIAGKVKAWAKALTGPTSLPGKYPQLMNPPGSETGPGQLVTWGKSIVCSVDAFDFKFQWTTNSSKHIPFDWTGPGQFVPLTTRTNKFLLCLACCRCDALITRIEHVLDAGIRQRA